MRHLILIICSLLIISCSQKSDKSQPTCEQTPNTESCLSQHKVQLNQCFNEICGNEGALSLDEINKIAKKREYYKPDTKLYKNVETAINAKIQLSQKLSQNLMKAYYHYLTQDDIKLSDTQKSAANRNFFIKFYEAAFFVQHPFYNLMSKNLPGIPKTFTPTDNTYKALKVNTEDKKWLQSVFKAHKFINLPRYLVGRYHGTSYIMEEYPGIELEEAIGIAASECINTDEKIQAKLGIPSPLYMRWRPQICRRILERPRSIINMNIFSQQLQKSKQFEYFFSDELDDIWLTREISAKKLLETFQQTNTFKIIDSYDKIDLVNDQNAQSYIKKSINQCHTIIGKTYETSPTKKQRKDAQRAIEAIRQITKEKFYFTDKYIKNFFENEVDDIQFQFPMFRGDYENEILDVLSLWKKDLDKIHTITDNKSLLTALLLISPTTPLIKVKKAKNTQGLISLRNIEGLCKNFASLTYSDHFYGATGHAYVSWNVMKNIDTGFGTIAHEFGHGVSAILRKIRNRWPGEYYLGLPQKNSIWERRACVDKFHGDNSFPGIVEENQYTEEDWADYFSSTIMNNYKGDLKKPKNFLCSAIDKVDLFKQDGSSHASRTFRAIHIHKNTKGELPASCNQAMKRKKMPTCF